MTDKKRKAVSLDPVNHEFLSNQDNASALVNRLVEQYRTGGQKEDILRKYRLEQERAERESLRRQLELKEEMIDELKSTMTAEERQVARVVADAVENIDDDVPADPSNPAIENWASKAGLPPEEFAERLEEARDDA